MKQKLLALLCALALSLSLAPAAQALTGESARAADTLYTLGLVRGTGTSSGYALDAPATRAAAVTMLVRLTGAERAAAADNWISGFRDIPASLTAAVNYATHQGWVMVNGLDFYPASAVTADGWFTYLLRLLGYRDQAGDFDLDGAARFARHIGLTSKSYTGELTRRDLFSICCEVLTFPYKGTEETVIARLVSAGAVSPAAANALGLLSTELTARQAADRHTAAVFRLSAYETADDARKMEPTANASGFFITADGVAVTNYHTIEDAVYAEATLVTGERYAIDRVLYYDAGIDIAVLQISRHCLDTGRSASAFASLEVVGTGEVYSGDTVYALGNPLGLGLAVSAGIVSDPQRVVERYTLPCVMDTADISQGSSGGALMNVYGQVIAVTSGAYTYGNNMYLAVPADLLLTADLSGEGLTLLQVKTIERNKNS